MKKIKKLSYKTRREDGGVDPCPNCTAHDVTIGTQTWTGCNLNTAIYRDGSTIPFIDNAIDWNNATTGAWSYYNNDPSTEAAYGKLYNWYAATDTLHGGIAPLGYHVPTDTEWTILSDYLGGDAVAGGAMKEEGLCHWITPNTGATNSSGFTALPGGSQQVFTSADLGYNSFWWSSTEESLDFAWYKYLSTYSANAGRNRNSKNWGLSIRLIKDEVAPCPDVLIDTQEWTSCNTIVSTYRNGDPIPYVSDPTAWATLTTGAWCYYDNDPANEDVYGKLYNWYAITDPRGIAPVGYHVPTQTEWDALRTSLGGESIAGGAMKEAGLTHWQTPNTGATNSSGFRSLPGGMRSITGVYSNKNIGATWHSSTQIDAGTYSYNNYYNTEQASFNFLIDSWFTGNDFRIGRSLRFVKGEAIPCPSCEEYCHYCIDHDVTIGSQTWTGCNANVAFYSNGDPIPQVTNQTDWNNATTGAWCYYNNNPATEAWYGKLYNWYAVNDPRGIAPTGYHVPSELEWNTLITALGGSTVAGGAMKEKELCHWNAPNTGATNSSGFTALGSGLRTTSNFYSNAQAASWWSSTGSLGNGIATSIGSSSSASSTGLSLKQNGYSLRFLKDEISLSELVIGTQTWTNSNLDVSTYRNGDLIPYVDNPTTWASLTTGAWCWYNNDPANGPIYGKLYNWYAVNDPRGIAPIGYHMPIDADWITLTAYLGGAVATAAALKEVGTTHWAAANSDATNSSGFTALPGGLRFNTGVSNLLSFTGIWWSLTELNSSNSIYFGLGNNPGGSQISDISKKSGLSIRLIKD